VSIRDFYPCLPSKSKESRLSFLRIFLCTSGLLEFSFAAPRSTNIDGFLVLPRPNSSDSPLRGGFPPSSRPSPERQKDPRGGFFKGPTANPLEWSSPSSVVHEKFLSPVRSTVAPHKNCEPQRKRAWPNPDPFFFPEEGRPPPPTP